jgi:hypothetical protein
MPSYIRRTPEQFHSFYETQDNPEGRHHICVLCGKACVTQSGMLSHLRKCVEQEFGEPYSDAYEIGDGFTIRDAVSNRYVVAHQIREYITSNSLEQYHERSSHEIIRVVMAHLLSKGHTECDLYNEAFKIYRYFFETTEEEENAHTEYRVQEVLRRL